MQRNLVYEIITYEIDDKDRLVFVDEAWARFARVNQAAYLAEPTILGRSLWDFIVDRETRLIYGMLFDKVRALSESLEFPFRCDTPTQRRYLQMELHPRPDEHIQLVSCVLREETRDYMPLLDPAVIRSTEFLTICSWCKRIELPQAIWAEVEVAVDMLRLFNTPMLPQLSHGICPTCLHRFRSGHNASRTQRIH